MNNEHDENHNQNDPEDLGSDPDVPIVHLPPPKHPHHPTIEAQHRRHYIKSGTDFIRKHWPTAATWNAVGSLVAAIATIVMVVVYMQIKAIMVSSSGQTDKLIDAAKIQAKSATQINMAAQSFAQSSGAIRENTNKAVQELERSAKTSEDAVKQAATNAQNALNLSIQTTQFQMRPWLGVYDKRISSFTNDGVSVDILFQNSGQTPALKVLAKADIYVMPGITGDWKL